MKQSKKVQKKASKPMIYVVGIILIIGLAGYMVFGSKSEASNTGNKKENNAGKEVQEVVLGVKDYNYYPNTVTVKSGKPVKITLDKTVTGCLRSFMINGS